MMFQDLGGQAPYAYHGERKHLIDVAHRFFFSPSQRSELEAWCDDAGLDPDYVRQKAEKVAANGLPKWKAQAGKGPRYQERKAYRERVKLRTTRSDF
jgi:hypothetical protein